MKIIKYDKKDKLISELIIKKLILLTKFFLNNCIITVQDTIIREKVSS